MRSTSHPPQVTFDHPPLHTHRRGSSSSRPQGFAIIMLLLLLFLMMLMAIAYLRTMRVFSETRTSSGISSAMPVANQLVQDLALTIGADGNLSTNEPYDYPWTCSRMNAPYRLSYPKLFSAVGAVGDPLVDDTWLSPIEPVDDLVDPTIKLWSQVSNPVGSFLVYTSADLSDVPPNFSTRDRVPMDAPAGQPIPGVAVDGSGLPQSVRFQNLNVTDPRLVDVDGDGIGDSLWFYPSMSWSNGVRYIAAVKIVDLSGMLNINTALGEFGSVTNSTSGTPLKGEGPYEINGYSLLGTMPASSKTFRQGPVPPSVPSGRAPAAWSDWDYWWAAGARVNNNATSSGVGATRYGLTDEIQLRDYANQYTTTPFPTIRSHYPLLKARLPAVSPVDYTSADRLRVTTLGGVCEKYAPLPVAGPFRDGSSFSSLNSNGANPAYARRLVDIFEDQNNYNQPAPAAPYPAITGSVYSGFTSGGWWDTCQFYESGTYAVTDFLQGINNSATVPVVYPTGANGTEFAKAYPYPEGFKNLTRYATPDDRSRQYQIQMGPNVFQDTLGRDNAVTVGSQWMGWEPQPIMTEFYAHMPYVVQAPYAWLPVTAATAVKVFPNTLLATVTLSDLKNLAGMSANIWTGGAGVRSNVYFPQNIGTGSPITFQYQMWDGTWTRAQEVTLTQSGADVVAYQSYAKYTSGGSDLGSDFSQATVPSGHAITIRPPTTNWGSAGDGVKIGLPSSTNTAPNWNQIYVNLVANRTATGGAGNSLGESIFGGNNLTSNDWRASGAAGIGSYAVEFCNPYQVPSRIANMRFTFRRQDWHVWDTFRWAQAPSYYSADLSQYVNAAPPVDGAGNAMSRDAEGYYVLKPGERVVFYRNGLEYAGPGGARHRPFGGPPLLTAPVAGTPAVTDISGLVPSATGVYKVDLTPFNAAAAAPYNISAPDINGYPSTWNVATIDVESACQGTGGGPIGGNYAWINTQRLVWPSLYSGWDAGSNCYRVEGNVPNTRQGAPGDLVYKQVDVRTFGVAAGLNLLQARLGTYPYNNAYPNQMPKDLGDQEVRTNTFAKIGNGVLTAGRGDGALPFPDGGQAAPNTWSPGCNNTASTMPLLTTTFLEFDPGVSSLGAANKLAFPGAAQIYPGAGVAPVVLYPDAPGALTLNGVTYSPYTTRQDISKETWMWNYVGIPGGPFTHPVTGVPASYPGTFPELTALNNTSVAMRDNSSANGGVERRDGLPRVLDLLKVPLVGPLYANHWPGSWIVGNSSYRGTGTTGWWDNGPTPNPLTGAWCQNTIGDALNYCLIKDTERMGLRGLALRTDVPWFDWNQAASYPGLATTLPTAAGVEYISGGDIFISQGAGPWPEPDTGVGGNVGPASDGKAWGYSNGPYAKASKFWQQSWAQVLTAHWQVDSMKYKGKTPANGDNFKPGMINLNTASAKVLRCLSLPPGVDPAVVASTIIANRTAGVAGSGGTRKGLAMTSEAFGAKGMKSYTTDATLLAGSGANLGTAKFYTDDVNLNLDTMAWLPQQATCRSDVFCAYIVVQGYNDKDFTMGALEYLKVMAIYSRDCSGNAASILIQKTISRRKTSDGDINDWYTP